MKEKLFNKAKIGWNMALIIAGLILGFFFAAQWNISPELSLSTPLRSREDLAASIMRLESEQASLKKNIDQLCRELTLVENKIVAYADTRFRLKPVLLDDRIADIKKRRRHEKKKIAAVELAIPRIKALQNEILSLAGIDDVSDRII